MYLVWFFLCNNFVCLKIYWRKLFKVKNNGWFFCFFFSSVMLCVINFCSNLIVLFICFMVFVMIKMWVVILNWYVELYLILDGWLNSCDGVILVRNVLSFRIYLVIVDENYCKLL